MRVLETLSTPTGMPSIFRYRRDSRVIHVEPVSPHNPAFELPYDCWAMVLADLAGEGALFSLERELPDQSPYVQLYERLVGLDVISEDGSLRPPEPFECACIAAILFHEGYFILHQGGLGVGRQTARIILRRSR